MFWDGFMTPRAADNATPLSEPWNQLMASDCWKHADVERLRRREAGPRTKASREWGALTRGYRRRLCAMASAMAISLTKKHCTVIMYVGGGAITACFCSFGGGPAVLCITFYQVI